MMTLLSRRRFLPFFVCQFLGAFNDSVFRLAMVAMLNFGLIQTDYRNAFIQLAAACFMLPFFLFSAVAGDLIDRLHKRPVLRLIKVAECLVMAVAAMAMLWKSLPLMFFCLFFAGAQSAFFGPMKYGLLPALLRRDEVLAGNAWFSVSTFAAILLGTVIGTAAGRSPDLLPFVAGGVVIVAVAGLLAAWLVPVEDAAPPRKAVWRPLRAFTEVMRIVRDEPPLRRRILAASWFWLIAVLLLNELATQSTTAYTTLLWAVLGGVATGALFCAFIFRGEITTGYAPAALLVGGVLLFVVASQIGDNTAPPSLLLIVAVVAVAAVMTVYVVPLRASIQVLAAEAVRARVMAAYNIYNALFIVVAAIVAALIHLVAGDGGSKIVLTTAAVLMLLYALPACVLLPLETLRRLLRRLFCLLFRVTVHGEENLDGNKAVIVSNHVSLWDAVLLSVFLEKPERRFCFAIDVEQSKRFYIRPLLKLVIAFPLNPMQPHAIRQLIRKIKESDLRPLIFPEGRISVSGGLMKIYPGAGLIAEKISGGEIVPIHIEGAEFSKLSRMQGKFRLRWFPTIHIHVGKPQKLSPPPLLRAQQRRAWMAAAVAQALEWENFHARRDDAANLTAMFAARMKRHGGGAPLFAEFPLRRLNYVGVYRAAIAVGRLLLEEQPPQDTRVGFLLPSSVGAAVVFYGSVFQGLTPVMLNPSAGRESVLTACRAVSLAVVYTSERLLERSPATVEIVAALHEAGIRVVVLESLRARLGLKIKLAALLASLVPQWSAARLPGHRSAPDDIACVLFTSGSEGVPKGVGLSHRNLLSNSAQVLSRLDATPADTLLNALPVFHSFGMLAGLVLPVMAGLEAWQYPSPLHYRLVPEAAYGCNATIFFSTDTFLFNYGRVAHPSDFVRLRLAYAGGEKLQERTRQQWATRFGVRLLEGYGVTETSPALALNTPAHNRVGTVGRIVAGVETQLLPVEGIERGGRLLVRGPNIMQGYYLAQQPGVLQPPPDGWHDTGDIADIDNEGYITLLGRAKRFIKVAGEMVPLDGIEKRLVARWSDDLFAVVGIADPRRGEVPVLMTTAAVNRDDIAIALQEEGMPTLWVPRKIKIVTELPLLPTGKINYPQVTAIMAEEESVGEEEDEDEDSGENLGEEE